MEGGLGRHDDVDKEQKEDLVWSEGAIGADACRRGCDVDL